ncbi:MAG: sodium:solute symporter family protein [Lutibacter sp.]|uniref:sodium:solute symporter family protein n=1 Tax=Lutibacter sp. TaxID=1925666 RepID=UPI0017BE8943|nr:sodium:solute symporter family protein [Lutibacter sp.]MBT8317457.1 sodium:solute symporter family protein [Lutibacter sp.]NNJ58316.1 sodium:solute symporter family protein [Lutibacter sp.]
MEIVDIIVFIIYMILVLGIGFYYFKKNKDVKDYYIGGGKMNSLHVGLSVVATDVGGGFSIGLGGLGFMMGLSGSWMLFTGLIGAWLSAVFLIPKVVKQGNLYGFLTFPEFLKHNYGATVAMVAGVISFIGYLGFTSSQFLAGAKLATGTFPSLDLLDALLIMGGIALLYTVFGGMKAVIYTDTFQWIILMFGLIFIGIPIAYNYLGGYHEIVDALPNKFYSLQNVSWVQLVNWFVIIVPIWFVGMTLYQRIYSCKSEETAKKAWFIAGLFEYPVMAFMGVILGLFARVAAAKGLFIADGYENALQMDPEMGMPILLKTVLPVGFMGLMLSAYFSAIMSTADSCLLAASGNFVTDILGLKDLSPNTIRISQITTFLIGGISILIASSMQSVLDLMLLSYSFMVSGLLIPVLGILISKKRKPKAALAAMLLGGFSTLILTFLKVEIPYGFDPILIGISLSLLAYLVVKK